MLAFSRVVSGNASILIHRAERALQRGDRVNRRADHSSMLLEPHVRIMASLAKGRREEAQGTRTCT